MWVHSGYLQSTRYSLIVLGPAERNCIPHAGGSSRLFIFCLPLSIIVFLFPFLTNQFGLFFNSMYMQYLRQIWLMVGVEVAAIAAEMSLTLPNT